MSECLIALNSHAVATRAIGIDGICVIHSNVHLVVLYLVQTRLLRILIVDIGHESASWIGNLLRD